MFSDLNGKVALVTGATSGIGIAIANRLAQNGASVVVAGRSQQNGDEVVRRIQDKGGHARFFKADLSDFKQCESLVDYTVKTFGRLDIACNNAGIGGVLSPVADYPLDVWKSVLDINVTGIFSCLKFELTAMLKQQSPGVIVNMTSAVGQVGLPFCSAYSASKHAIIGLTKSAALEYAASGIRINAVGPAYVETPLLDAIPAEIRNTLSSYQPLGRLGTVDEVADLVVWLSSEKASFITGAFLPVDGGYLAQ